MGRDHRYRHISSLGLVKSVAGDSIQYLIRQCLNQQDLSIVIDGTTLDESGPGGLSLDLYESHIFFQFDRVKTFKLRASDSIIHHSTVEDWVTYANAPTTFNAFLKLEAEESALKKILNRLVGTEDVLQKGISEVDPDYIWLKEHYEKYYGKHSRLVELVLRKKAFWKLAGEVTR